jgi:cell division protein FtsL
MPAYIQGNLAVNPKQEQRKGERVKIRETTKVVYRKPTLPTQEKLLYLFTVVVLVLTAGVILFRYAQVYQMNASILQMQKEMKQMQAENMALKQEIDKLQSLPRLQEEAEKLGMGPIDDTETKAGATKTASSQTQAQTQAQGKTADTKKPIQPGNGAKVAMR